MWPSINNDWSWGWSLCTGLYFVRFAKCHLKAMTKMAMAITTKAKFRVSATTSLRSLLTPLSAWVELIRKLLWFLALRSFSFCHSVKNCISATTARTTVRATTMTTLPPSWNSVQKHHHWAFACRNSQFYSKITAAVFYKFLKTRLW